MAKNNGDDRRKDIKNTELMPTEPEVSGSEELGSTMVHMPAASAP